MAPKAPCSSDPHRDLVKEKAEKEPSSSENDSEDETDEQVSSSEEEDMAPKASTTPSSDPRDPVNEKQEKESSSEDSDDETSEESSEEEQEENEKLDGEKLKNTKTQNRVTQSESKSTEGSDSKPNSEGSISDYKVQPVPNPSAGKRSRKCQGSVDGSNKKSRIEEQRKPPSTSSGGLITRLWSEKDEMTLLNGMIDFRNRKGRNPTADMGALHDHIKGKLQESFSKQQLRTKISRLKKRFSTALKKRQSASGPVFEDTFFQLSKKIWGGAAGAIGSNKKDDTVKVAAVIGSNEKEGIVEVVGEDKENDFWSKHPWFNDSFDNIMRKFPLSFALSESAVSLMKGRLSLMGSAKAKQIDEKWRQLIVDDAEINYKMLLLMSEQVKMASEQ